MQKHSDERKGGSDNEARKGLPRAISAAPTPLAAQAFRLRAQIRGIHWDAGKALLDLIQLCLANDRQYEIARKQAMDIIAGANRLEDQAINAVLFARDVNAPAVKE